MRYFFSVHTACSYQAVDTILQLEFPTVFEGDLFLLDIWVFPLQRTSQMTHFLDSGTRSELVGSKLIASESTTTQ